MDQHLWDGRGYGFTPVNHTFDETLVSELGRNTDNKKTSNFKVGELEEIVLKKKVDKLSEEV